MKILLLVFGILVIMKGMLLWWLYVKMLRCKSWAELELRRVKYFSEESMTYKNERDEARRAYYSLMNQCANLSKEYPEAVR